MAIWISVLLGERQFIVTRIYMETANRFYTIPADGIKTVFDFNSLAIGVIPI